MLLRFRVSNHLSLRDKQELSLVASSLKDNEEGLIDCPSAPGGKALPAAIIYGANASGKSNLVDALGFFRKQILFSHNRDSPGSVIRRTAFQLNPHFIRSPSEFYIDFSFNDRLHSYGFACSDDRFVEENLYTLPNGRYKMLFERKEQDFRFGRQLRGQTKIISTLTRPDSLFMSVAHQNRHKQIADLYSNFRDYAVETLDHRPSYIQEDIFWPHGIDEEIISFLFKIGTGIVGYRRKVIEENSEIHVSQVFLMSGKEPLIQSDWSPRHLYSEQDGSVDLAHRAHDGYVYYLRFENESAGTRRLLSLLMPVFQALDKGSVVVVDELDASLHTQACEAIVALFSSPKSNPKGAQLIATTHDTNLLRSPLLRRDQIWFTEKDDEGATHLYPLTDIRTRKGDNIEKGYLQGRYGAVPFSGTVADLIREL